MDDVETIMDANELLDLEQQGIVLLVTGDAFNCLAMRNVSVVLSPPYHKHVPTEEAIEELIGTANVEFAPQLLDVLQSDDPPTIDFWKSLPVFSLKPLAWGVYALVLEKTGCESLVYIGSGTNSELGVAHRLRDYDRFTHLPLYVSKALEEGYKIVHKGLLAKAPMPSASIMPTIRTLFITLEGTFQAVFWTLHTPNGGDWGLSDACR
jgi:hypothetical protein